MGNKLRSNPPAFFEWLDAKLEERGMNDNQLSLKAGISNSVISKSRSGFQAIGYEACKAIAKALKVRETLVLQLAGHLEPDEDLGQSQIEWLSLIDGKPEDAIRQYMAVIRAMQKEQVGSADAKAKKNRA